MYAKHYKGFIKSMIDIFTQNVLSPPILFFILGISAGFVKSDLHVPDQISRYLSIYLMMAIGFKGGVALSQTAAFNTEVLLTIFFGVLMGFLQPFVAYFFLTLTTKIDKTTAAAIAAHYGSISMITFVTATTFLETQNIVYAGYIIGVLALMEAPAILSGLFIAHRVEPQTIDSTKKTTNQLCREIFTNGSIMLLTGAFIIGYLTSTKGALMVRGFFHDPFQGILCFFLLDMGLVVSKELHHFKEFNIKMILFGLYMPLLGCIFGMVLSYVIGLDVGTGTLFTVLIASSSYIAVTAAMRLALPQAKAGVYIPMSLGITFPFNIAFGIPFYFFLAQYFLK